MDEDFCDATVERLLEGARVMKEAVENHLRGVIRYHISRPVYKSGKYAGEPWTAREPGTLEKSIRITQKKSRTGRLIWKNRDVRVYCGDFLGFYADIVESKTPFMEPAFWSSIGRVKAILGAK